MTPFLTLLRVDHRNAIRNDLVRCRCPSVVALLIRVLQQHPNEYIRGATLRFLQKISRDQELLEPLIPTCRSCLEHRHSYVRKNAVFAVYTIYREYENLIPDAPELIQTFLAAESDATCKRNAFVFLANCAMPKAVEYVIQVHDQIGSLDELLQMAIIDVIRLDCKADSTHRVSAQLVSVGKSNENVYMQSRWIRCIFELLNASSHAVQYEAATTLTSLTQHAAAVKGLYI
jgi:coatomer subunit beta